MEEINDVATEAPAPSRGRLRIITGGAVAAVMLAGGVAVAATSFGAADPAACETAVRAMIPSAFAGVDHSNDKPAACKGLSDAQLQAIGTKVFGDMFTSMLGGFTAAAEKAAADAVYEERAPEEPRTAPCRASLENQLRDVTTLSSSYDISRTSACDGVSDEEMKTIAAVIIHAATR